MAVAAATPNTVCHRCIVIAELPCCADTYRRTVQRTGFENDYFCLYSLLFLPLGVDGTIIWHLEFTFTYTAALVAAASRSCWDLHRFTCCWHPVPAGFDAKVGALCRAVRFCRSFMQKQQQELGQQQRPPYSQAEKKPQTAAAACIELGNGQTRTAKRKPATEAVSGKAVATADAKTSKTA